MFGRPQKQQASDSIALQQIHTELKRVQNKYETILERNRRLEEHVKDLTESLREKEQIGDPPEIVITFKNSTTKVFKGRVLAKDFSGSHWLRIRDGKNWLGDINLSEAMMVEYKNTVDYRDIKSPMEH